VDLGGCRHQAGRLPAVTPLSYDCHFFWAKPPSGTRWGEYLLKQRYLKSVISLFDSHKRWLFLFFVFLAAGSLAIGTPQIFSIAFLLALAIAVLHLLGGGPSGLVFRRGKFARRLRVTKSGRLLTLVACGIGAVALMSGLNLVHLVLGFITGAMAASWLVSKWPLSKISVTRFAPTDVFAGELFKVNVTLRNDKRWTNSFSVLFEDAPGAHPSLWPAKIYFSKLSPGAYQTLAYIALIPRRGLYKLNNCHLTTAFPFGFFERAINITSEAPLLVFPRLGQLNQEVVPAARVQFGRGATKALSKSGEEDFYGLREYRLGDNPHHIHWKSSAKLAKPLVKEFDRPEREEVNILLDTFIPDAADDERRENFELAISFVATLAKALEESRIPYSFYAMGKGLMGVPGGVGQPHFYKLLRTLAILESSSKHTVGDLIRSVRRELVSTPFLVAVTLGKDEKSSQFLEQISGRLDAVEVVDVSSSSFQSLFSLNAGSETVGKEIA
jgi:uncharacterized protein (DUF58 family)